MFQDLAIGVTLWLSRSPDLTECDFYLWNSMKDKVYKKNSLTLEKLKPNVTDKIESSSVFQDLVISVSV